MYQRFVAVSGNLGGKVPVVYDVLSSHKQEIYRTTSLDKNCIEFEFQRIGTSVDLRQTYLVLKLKFVKGRRCKIYNPEEKKKEHSEEGKEDEVAAVEEEQVASVLLVTHVVKILHSIFSNV